MIGTREGREFSGTLAPIGKGGGTIRIAFEYELNLKPLLADPPAALNQLVAAFRVEAAQLLGIPATPSVLKCPKMKHAPGVGYLHGAEDDSPYEVDGIRYCGRCHVMCEPSGVCTYANL